MPNTNPLSVAGQIVKDTTTNAYDATQMSGSAVLVSGVCVGAGFLLAPHLLAVYGAISLFGSIGRAGRHSPQCNYLADWRTGKPFKVICVQTIQEFIDDPANQ